MEKKEPLISVVVPVYNVEQYLPQCLDSLLAQTWKNLEIIVVDDGSPDGSWQIMEDYAARDSRIRLHRQKNGGLSAARNAGVELARGEWIGFLDSDDYAAPEMYETLYRAASERDAQIAVCSFTYVDAAGKPLPQHFPITKDETLTSKEILTRLGGPGGWFFVTVPNRLYRRELFETVRFPAGMFHEDEYTAHLFYWQCERVATVKKRMYYYVQRDGSIMHEESVKRRCDGIKALLGRGQFAAEHELYEVAFSSCNGVLGQLVNMKPPATAEEAECAAAARKDAEALIRRLLKTPGRYADKLKVLCYRISPRLYRWMLRQRQRLQ